MGWTGGTYTKWNGSGGWSADAAANIGIEAGRHDTQDTDFQNGINDCINKNGQNTPTADLPMGGRKHTNVANAVADTEYVALGQVKSGIDIQNTSLLLNYSQFSADSNGPRVIFRKSRNATVGNNTIVQAGDTLGSIGFTGANGTGYDYGALISCEVAQTPGASNDMPGRLKFYTTPDGSSTVGLKFQIDTNGASSFYTSLASDSTTHPLNVVKTDTTVTPGNNYFVGFFVNNGATACGRITSNGAGQAQFASTSDINLKENIVDLAPQLSNILALKPVEFDYKDGSGHQIGFIAQDVEQVYPDNVYTDPDGVKFIADMSRMDARLVKAIQDLNDKIEALTARVEALEGA